MGRISVDERQKTLEEQHHRGHVLSPGHLVSIAVALVLAATAAVLLKSQPSGSHRSRSPAGISVPGSPSNASGDAGTHDSSPLLPAVADGGSSGASAVGQAPVTRQPAHPATLPTVSSVAAFWARNFEALGFGYFGDENTEIVGDASGQFTNVLRVHYPKGSASPLSNESDGSPLGGMQRYLGPLNNAPADRLVLTYDVRFPDHFNFVKGGKLPGLYGGKVTNGRRIPDGENGLSTRYMWRAGGAGEVYAYLPTSQLHGTSLGRGNWKFSTGTWHQIQQEVVLNDVGRRNGSIKVWFDGRQVLDQEGLLFRTTNTLKIDGVLFSTFFGGGDPSWATPVDTYIDFANFTVSPTR